MKSLPIWLAATLVLLAACSHTAPADHSTFFLPTHTAAAAYNDSLEGLWRPTLGVYPSKVRRYDSIVRACGNDQDRARAYYWRAAVDLANDVDPTPLLDSALLLCDSAAYPYDWARIVSMRQDGAIPQPQMIREAIDQARIFSSVGDTLCFAIALSRLQYFLVQAGDTTVSARIGERYLDLTRQLDRPSMTQDAAFSNMLNAYLTPGRKVKADSLAVVFLEMMEGNDDPYLRFQKSVAYDVRNDLHPDSLFIAREWEYADKEDDLGATRTMAAGRKALWFSQKASGSSNTAEAREAADSARCYFDIFRRGLYPREGDFLKAYTLAVELYGIYGPSDSLDAFSRRMEREEYVQRHLYTTSASLGQLMPDLLALVETSPSSPSASSSPWRTPWPYIILCLCLCALAAATNRRKRRNNITAAETEKNTEANIEKNIALAAQIRAALPPDFTLLQLDGEMARLAPRFDQNLRDTYPGITAAQLRLARFLVLDIDAKTTAQILSISPDSVKKARNRLRHTLRLGPTAPLRTTLLRHL